MSGLLSLAGAALQDHIPHYHSRLGMQVLPAHPTPRRAQDATWCVTVVYDTAQRDEQRAGPIAATQCMSCELVRLVQNVSPGDSARYRAVPPASTGDHGRSSLMSLHHVLDPHTQDCPLSVGVGSGETQLTSRDTAVAEYAHHRAWLDAKARTMLVLTPNRHVRRLAQLRCCPGPLHRCVAALPHGTRS